MKRKTFLTFLLSLTMATAMLAGCGSTGTNSTSTDDSKQEEASVETEEATEAPASTGEETGGDESYNVYLITMDQMDQAWSNMDEGCQKAVDELGNVEYTWIAPDVKDDAKQIECVNNAVAGGADAILIAANGPDAVTAALKEADADGTKIVYVDSAADFPGVATFATDNHAAGKTAGEEMIKSLDAAGITEGSIGIVNVNSATASVVAREEGFREAFDGSKFTLLETQYSEGDVAKSKDMAANYITQGCVGLYGCNEGSTTGVGNAIQEAGNEVIGVGFDQSDAIRNLIKNGSLVCTMAQNSDVMGYEGMKAGVAALSGGYTGEESVDTGITVLTADKL